MAYYHDLITQKSFEVLTALRRKYDFILIGGWAVFLYTHNLKSKDVDLVVEYKDLEKLKHDFEVVKNCRLKKYEIVTGEGADIDIYVPFYSNPGLPAEELKNYVVSVENFKTVRAEVLAILKQKAMEARTGSAKGKKDLIDLLGLFALADFDFKRYRNLIKKYNLGKSLKFTRQKIAETVSIDEAGLNRHRMAAFKRRILPLLGD